MTVSSGTGTHASTATSHEAVSEAAGEATAPDAGQNQKVTGHTAHGYAADKDAYLRRLKRIEGQVRGIARMVDEDKYCIDILTQVAAVNSAMHAVSLGLLENHMQHCVVDAAHEAATSGSSDVIDAKVKEATQAISRLLR
ncbi:metal-sensitive transcriptional regulator [Arthrobacter sp. NPDC092385]|uniref:metal-sensitive transcriptional regulator n=1 Tax=Arthrobacter sp. NPDC092385 TaxID=3363943 RepID=UPI003811C049